MFKFLRKAKADGAAIREEVCERLNSLHSRVVYDLINTHGLTEQHPDAQDFMTRGGHVSVAIEMVRQGTRPGELQNAEPLIQAAIKVAHDAVNEGLLTNRNDNEILVGKLRRLLGYSADGARRQY